MISNMNATALLVTFSLKRFVNGVHMKWCMMPTNPSTYTRSSTSMRKKKEMTRETDSIALLTSWLPLEREKSTMTRMMSTMISTRPKTLQIRKEEHLGPGSLFMWHSEMKWSHSPKTKRHHKRSYSFPDTTAKQIKYRMKCKNINLKTSQCQLIISLLTGTWCLGPQCLPFHHRSAPLPPLSPHYCSNTDTT